MKRLICSAIGCNLHDDAPACRRCGGALYYDFIDRGWMEPIISLYYRIKAKLRIKRCAHCEKRMAWRSKDDFCSVECADTWIPF